MIFTALPVTVSAANSLATNFVDTVKNAADGNGELSEAIDILCPAKSASGRIFITHADYDYGKSKGVFIFKNTADIPANMMSIATQFHNDDLNSDLVDGYEFGFKIPKGQFFVTLMKNGNVTVGLNADGESEITEVKCKVINPQ